MGVSLLLPFLQGTARSKNTLVSEIVHLAYLSLAYLLLSLSLSALLIINIRRVARMSHVLPSGFLDVG